MKLKQVSILFFFLILTCNLHAIEVKESFFIEDSYTGIQNPDSISFLTVPNAFQPKGSMLMQVFQPVYKNITDYSIHIYNRWGLLIFESNDPGKGWDGTHKGKLCPVQSYVYRIIYYPLLPNGTKGEKIVKTGTVTLVE